MRCPKCGADDTRVIDSRMQDKMNAIKRRRECRACGYRFTTFERCEDPIEVIKSDGSTQPFDRNKLLVGLMRATSKRDIDHRYAQYPDRRHRAGAAQPALHRRHLPRHRRHGAQAPRGLDKVAYIRFASVYRDFKDIDEFVDELDKLR